MLLTDTIAPADGPPDDGDLDFTLDMEIIERLDPSRVINMTDDNCGSTCAGSTCITNA
jgi:FxLD family lantipeptide